MNTASNTGDERPTAPSGAGATPALPPVFGRYRVEGLLGRGGMGAVYKAHDTQLDRPVALKVPRLDDGDRARLAVRFLREARAAARLQHPNICPHFDAGEIEGVVYLSMALVDGQPLTERLKGGPLPPAEAAALVRSVALAMAEAHRAGVVHRDLKPANVMLNTRGEPVVMDFGLARDVRFTGEERLTREGALVGTPMYMPPEQFGGQEAGPAGDVYSLGVVLYEVLTGRVPFRAGSLAALVAQIERDPPPPPSRFRPGLPPELEAVCLRALAKRPGERFASMAAFAAALAPFAAGQPNLPAQPETTEFRPPRQRRWAAVAGGAALGGVLVLFLLALPLLNRHAPKGQVEEMPPAERLAAATEAGQRALADGNYRLALRELNAAVELRDRHPGLLAPAEGRRLTQWQRQSDLLARLLNRSLQEVAQEAALVRGPDEWQARFADDYRGRSVIFDDVVRRDADGRPSLSTYAVVVGQETVRLALEDLKLLEALPLAPPPRLLFGARLAGCAREKGGGWVVRFEPDSGVLLTDPGAAASCCPVPLGRELEGVLQRQEEWLRDLAGQRPAR